MHSVVSGFAPRLAAAALIASTACGALAQAPSKIVFASNWRAQAEHGGFYQATAEGIYRKHGLAVELRPGGPQVNVQQLLLAGQFDVIMGYDLATLSAIENGIPLVTIGATFQKHPSILMSHPGPKTLADLKGRPVAISTSGSLTFWPWLRASFGFDDGQKRPYAFSIQPFLVDKNLVQQGYVTSEPFMAQKGGVTPAVFLLAEYGYPPYGDPIVTTRDVMAKRKDDLRRFLRATAEGWKSYFANPAPGNALIQKDNPQMPDDQIAYGIAKMKEYGLVTGGDAVMLGVMAITDARWKKTCDFMKSQALLKPETDCSLAYTTELVKDLRVLP